jgi:hypothetical protein
MPGATYITHSPPAHCTFSCFLLIIEHGLISELPFDFLNFRGHHSDNESEVYV